MRQSIPLNEIKVPERIRRSVRDIDGLADSIRQHGLLCPVGLTEDKTLVYGFRRLSAVRLLGLDRIDYVDAREAPEDELKEMEFVENYEREDFTWQEECLGILAIYRKKRLRGMQEGWTWGVQQCSEMFKMSLGTVDYVLKVAKRLEAELALPEDKRKYWNYESANEAYRLGILGEEEDRINMDLAKQQQVANAAKEQALLDQVAVSHVERLEASPDALAEERARYEANPLNKIPFEEYWAERKRLADEAKNTIYLSTRFHNVDCIEFMNQNPDSYDHIITDPPYGIDMDNLNQQNQHGGLVDLDRVVDAHQVDENMALLAKFFPAAYRCTRDKAFVCVCGDPMLWQHMYDTAIAAGFAVQRWPLIWRKVNQSVMNNCPGYNTTKDYEIVMLCRKPGATLMQKRNSSIVDASNVEATKLTGHPFAKPFDLTKALVEMVSLPNQTILEPFAGGGSLVLEMLKQKRNVVACEKDVNWYNNLLSNVKNHFYLKLNPKFIFK